MKEELHGKSLELEPHVKKQLGVNKKTINRLEYILLFSEVS